MSEAGSAVREASDERAEEFQETRIGRLPADWSVETLTEATSVNPEGWDENDWPTDTFEYVSLEDASEGEIRNSSSIPLDETPSRAQRQIREGDVLVGTVRPKQRSHGFVTEEHAGAICSSGFGVLRTEDSVNSYYLNQEVLSHRFFRQMEAYVAGSGYPAVKLSDLRKHRIAIPPLEEQRKIASVLYNINHLIQKTKSVIKQTARLRTGLLQDLLLRGLAPDGSLRPPPNSAPSEYRETRGRVIPRDWGMENLADIGHWSSGKTPTRSEGSFWGGDIPWVTAKDMKRLRVTETEDQITQSAMDSGASMAPPDCVLILVRGMILDHTLPIVRPTREVSFNQDVKAIIPDDGMDPDFLAYLLKSRSNEVLALVTAATHGTKRLATDSLGSLAIPVPSLEEQKEIVSKVRTFEKRISREKSLLDELERVKLGLMQDLLSGEVRTHDKDIESLPEVKQHG